MRLGLREWGPAELWAGLRGAMGLTARASSEAALTRWFSERFGVPALMLNSGSSALQLALQLLSAQNPDRDEVVLPALACPALTRVVLACGLKACYADIGANLNTPVDALHHCLGPRSLAVILVHAYGHPADSAGIQALCEQAGVALIDDAAQRIEPGSGLGTAGDFGIFSFAQSKSVVCGIDGSGGVLLVNSRRQQMAMEQRWRELPVAERRRLAWLEFLLTPRAPQAAYYVSRWRRRGAASPRRPARIAGVDAAIALPQLASLERRQQRRRQLLEQYREALHRFGIEAPQLASAASPDYLARLMVRIVPEQREACRNALAAQGIASRLPYRLPAALDPLTCPQATRSAAELLELPLPAHWTADDIALLARSVAPFCVSETTH
ncbi:MAG: DegT/DnrJ/EryC1/StrS family aminotransferase [Rhodoferax sp.]|uniref:DegT/DnrJ/EryC1/StrS family aminotransferase n=1 Tax=Rhodoferax sp. TaxID=50421 RepID=UPI002715F535|nr:DegT/DnrJ/EryC1/StrS family aminotransferase [Rhodoferax sp.]MDO8450877.1 DegT/DnrJ/EryC1/StrS family aminotransferase [Rhodoferax sp.]